MKDMHIYNINKKLLTVIVLILSALVWLFIHNNQEDGLIIE